AKTKTAKQESTELTAAEVKRQGAVLYPLQFLKGIGPARAAALAEAGVRTVRDLLMFAPKSYLDRRTVLPLRQTRLLLAGEEGVPNEVTVIVQVRTMQLIDMRNGRKRLIMRVYDE